MAKHNGLLWKKKKYRSERMLDGREIHHHLRMDMLTFQDHIYKTIKENYKISRKTYPIPACVQAFEFATFIRMK